VVQHVHTSLTCFTTCGRENVAKTAERKSAGVGLECTRFRGNLAMPQRLEHRDRLIAGPSPRQGGWHGLLRPLL
jgi:hypothetical protein